MGKDAYFFSHDSNARNDRKCKALIRKHGLAGYGMYWVTVEILREESEFYLPYDEMTFDMLADEFKTDPESAKHFIDECINTFSLFEFDEEKFWSNSLNRRMNKMKEVSEKRKEAARKRWEKGNAEQNNTSGMQMHSKSNANGMHEMKVNEMKENEMKENEMKENIHSEVSNKNFLQGYSQKDIACIKQYLEHKERVTGNSSNVGDVSDISSIIKTLPIKEG